MSDYEDEFMCDDQDEDYDLEYSEDSNSEPDVDLENQYYNSKALKEEDPKAALESFQRVLDLENAEKGEWGFKALKQMIKINFRLQNFDEMMNLWVRKVCSAKGMNMLPYFEFWQFPVNVSPSTSEACNQ